MKGVVFSIALSAAISTGCVTYERGGFAALSTTTPPLEMTVVAEEVEGRACGSLFEAPLRRAISDALVSANGANALTDVTYRVEKLCMIVRGRAVYIP